VSGDAIFSAGSDYIIVPCVKDLNLLTNQKFVLTLFNDKGKLSVEELHDWEETYVKVIDELCI
jgi:hypothetical protein